MKIEDILIHINNTDKRNYLSEWKQYEFAKGEHELPDILGDIIQENISNGNRIFEYAHIWYRDAIFYRGNVNTTNDWLFITNGGNFYKHGKKYCIWETRTWINREKFPYPTDKTMSAIPILKEKYLYLGTEYGPFSSLAKELSMYYFGLNVVGTENFILK